MGSEVFAACYLLVLGNVILTGCGIAFAATTGRSVHLRAWGTQGVGIVIAAVTVFYFYGWLLSNSEAAL